jgi:hypothetical protein
MGKPRLSVEQILAWADAHRQRTGCWPRPDSGPIRQAPSENWGAINAALCRGLRGLPGGDCLSRLLVRYGRTVGRWARPGRWTEAEDAVVRVLPPAEAARQTGRSLTAIYARRRRLGVPRIGP